MAEDEIKLDEDVEQKSGGIGKKLMKMGLVIMILAAQLCVAYFMVGRLVLSKQIPSTTSEEVLERAASDPASSEENGPKEMGEVYMLQDIVVNPAHTGGMRYLVTSMGLELSDPSLEKEMEKREPQIRDQVITLLSRKGVEELVDVSRREEIREELLTAINAQLVGGKVRKLYFVKYVLQ